MRPREQEENGPAADEPSADVVELALAEGAEDLWFALEAAQGGRVVVHEGAFSAEEKKALGAVGAILERVIESWADEVLQNKAPLLRLLDEPLEALRGHGLSLHWGCVDRQVLLPGGEETSMRIAVIAIGATSAGTRRIAMPLALDASDAEGSAPPEDGD